MAAIVAATATNAELIGLDHLIGTLTPGKLADLLIVDSDPLDNVTVLRNLSRIHVVMAAGQVAIDRTQA